MSRHLTKKAPSRKQLKQQAQAEQMTRALRALAEHHRNPPEVCDRRYVDKLADRHFVNPLTMRRMIQCDAELRLQGEL